MTTAKFPLESYIELPERIKLYSPADITLQFDIETNNGTVQFHFPESSRDITPSVEIKRIRSTNFDRLPQLCDVVPFVGDNHFCKAFIGQIPAIAEVLDCLDYDAKILTSFIPVPNTLLGYPRLCYSEQNENSIEFHFQNMEAGEYLIILRKVYCCAQDKYIMAAGESSDNLLPAEKVNQTVQDCFCKLTFLATEYAQGFYTKSDFYNAARSILYKRSFPEFSNGLQLTINHSSWGRLLEDYQMWKSGLFPCSSLGEPWLVSDKNKRCEANVSDKRQFFRLMGAFHAHIDQFEPMPKTIIRYEKEHIHTYHACEAVMIGFNCVDDGGLLTEPDPCDKTFILKSDKGLKAVLRIIETHGRHKTINAFGSEFDFRCSGYIEGYTVKGQRDSEIYIVLSENGQITDFFTFMDGRDYNAFFAFPLWQECHKWEWRKRKKREADEERFFDSFIFSMPETIWT